MGHARMGGARQRRGLELVFTPQGHVELCQHDDVLWASDDDEDFRDQYPREFYGESDANSIMDYLVDHNYLTEIEAQNLELTEEAFDGEAESEGPDDDDDDPNEEDGTFDDNEVND
jgi:hypothetical protein